MTWYKSVFKSDYLPGNYVDRFLEKYVLSLLGLVLNSLVILYRNYDQVYRTIKKHLFPIRPLNHSNKCLETGENFHEVINQLVCQIYVPRHFLNDRNIIYMSNVMCTITLQKNDSG